jgi:hypothetical protein
LFYDFKVLKFDLLSLLFGHACHIDLKATYFLAKRTYDLRCSFLHLLIAIPGGFRSGEEWHPPSRSKPPTLSGAHESIVVCAQEFNLSVNGKTSEAKYNEVVEQVVRLIS